MNRFLDVILGWPGVIVFCVLIVVLAAQEQRPLSQEHLLRAIALEYRELGKLSTSGRME